MVVGLGVHGPGCWGGGFWGRVEGNWMEGLTAGVGGFRIKQA